jgi:DNA-binding MarR family transcriptional regulator
MATDTTFSDQFFLVPRHYSLLSYLLLLTCPFIAYTKHLSAYLGREMLDTRSFPRLLRATYLGMHRLCDAHFARHGVTADQFVVLAALAEQSDVTQQDLVRRVSSDPSTVRAMLMLLEGRGLVKRERHPGDGRARSVSLTARGRRLFDKLWAASEPIREQLLAGFEPHEIETLLTLLHRVIANVSLPKVRPVTSGKE